MRDMIITKWKQVEFVGSGVIVPVDGMSWLAARVIADLDMTLVKLNRYMIIVPIV